ncbi:MAG: anti-sigma regulatory factor [Planctomycetes bacterium]|nr:anti-sigma regulatory factor [Planctomycetota bacterium]
MPLTEAADAKVVAREAHPVRSEDDVVLVRRRARELAQRRGFDGFAQAAITTATSEIARNALVHGGGGEATLEELDRAGRAGVRLTCRDQGPGIVDLARALRGGFSATGTLGLGLSGARRLVDEFEVQSAPGEGTTVVLTKWARR